MTDETSVGVLGTGKMGASIALRLRERGTPVLAWNRTRERLAPLVEAGAVAVATPADLAGAPIVALVVSDEGATRETLGGSGGLLGALGPEHVVVHLGTIGPRAARSVAEQVARTGAAYVDAPVLGSTDRAQSGELLAMVGALPAALDRARPFLDAIATKTVHAGEVGAGSSLKLIANMLLARYVEALGEVLALTRAFGLDPSLVLYTIQSSALSSPMWNKAKGLQTGTLPVHFALRHMAKDLRLLDEEVERHGLSLPGHEAVYAMYQEVLATGHGDLDYSELARVVAQIPRTSPPSTRIS